MFAPKASVDGLDLDEAGSDQHISHAGGHIPTSREQRPEFGASTEPTDKA
jgi:hypothetical protein